VELRVRLGWRKLPPVVWLMLGVFVLFVAVYLTSGG
jgi:hypothetical protein